MDTAARLRKLIAEATKGPWTAGEVRWNGWDQIIRGADRGPIASLNLAGYAKRTGKAHARLIVTLANCAEEIAAVLEPTKTWELDMDALDAGEHRAKPGTERLVCRECGLVTCTDGCTIGALSRALAAELAKEPQP